MRDKQRGETPREQERARERSTKDGKGERGAEEDKRDEEKEGRRRVAVFARERGWKQEARGDSDVVAVLLCASVCVYVGYGNMRGKGGGRKRVRMCAFVADVAGKASRGIQTAV